MIEYNLDTEHSILHVQPKSALEQDDFVKLAKAVDPHIEATGGLVGLIIEAPSFPGWKSFGALRYPSPWRHIHALRGADQPVQKVPSRDGHPGFNLRIVQSRWEINGPAAQCIWHTNIDRPPRSPYISSAIDS
ncbi:MAG: hypothetical protein ABWY20_14870 [Mycobacterium sp.]